MCVHRVRRIGGIITYDITNPRAPVFVGDTNNRNSSSDPQQFTAGDLAPGGLAFIPVRTSPSAKPFWRSATN